MLITCSGVTICKVTYKTWKSVVQEVHYLPNADTRIAHDKFRRSPKPHYNLAKFVLQKVECCPSLSCSLCDAKSRLY